MILQRLFGFLLFLWLDNTASDSLLHSGKSLCPLGTFCISSPRCWKKWLSVQLWRNVAVNVEESQCENEILPFTWYLMWFCWVRHSLSVMRSNQWCYLTTIRVLLPPLKTHLSAKLLFLSKKCIEESYWFSDRARGITPYHSFPYGRIVWHGVYL